MTEDARHSQPSGAPVGGAEGGAPNEAPPIAPQFVAEVQQVIERFEGVLKELADAGD